MDVLQCKWSRLISSQPSVRIPAPDAGGAAASSASPSKGAKAAKRGGAAAAPSTSVIGNGPDDIPARFGGCSFLYRDTTYVLGANMRGVFECFSIVPAEDGPTSPTAGAGRSVSPKKSKKGASSSAGGGDQLSSPTKNLSNSLGQSKMTAKQVPITGTKAPPPRTLPAICVASTAGGGGATSAATHKAATTSPPAASITIEGQQACDSFFNCQVSSVYVHGGLQLSTSEADATATLGNAVSTPASGSGLDDLWEFKCHQMGWQPVAVRTSLLSKRFAHSLAFTHGRLYLFGGVDSRTLGTLGDFWVLEDSGNAGKRWTPVISHGTCSAGSASGVDDASVMRLQRPCARSHHNLVPAPDGCLLLHGGISTHGAILNDLWCVRVAHEASLASVYDPVTEVSLDANISCIPLVVWRRVELPGNYIPRKLGSTLLVAPMPKLPQAAARRSSTAATAAIVTFHQNEYSLTPQYLILICGGWDADSLSPFVAPRPQHHSNQQAGVQNNPPTTTSDYEPSPMMQRLASMAFSSVDGGSFRFASFRRGSTAGDTPLRMLEKSMSPFRRRQSQAERDHDDGSQQQQQQQAEQQPTATPMPPPVTKRQPLVVAFVANMDKWRADHNPSEFTSSPRSSAAHGEAHGGLENADLESLGSHGVGSGGQGGRGVSPQPKQPAPAAAVALSKSKVLGKRFTVANSAGRLAQSTFSRASHRSCDYVTSLATLQKQLVPPRLEISKLDSVAISSSAMVPPAVHSPVSRTGPPTLDASALEVKKDDGGADGAMSSSDCLPIATMFGYWCRSQASTGGKQSQSASALELTAFGGNCGPMVACGDVWRCRVEWLPQPMFDFNKIVPFNSL